MFAILISVLTTTWLLVLFKLFPKYKIDTFQAVVVNYFVAFTCGILLYGNTYQPSVLTHLSWLPYAILSGFLFISMLMFIGMSSQRNGVSMTTVAVKMSMAVSMIFMIVVYQEKLSFIKIGGILAAFIGVVLMSFPFGNKSEKSSSLWMLFVLFFGCGALDFVLNYVQNYHLQHLSTPLFSAIGLGTAGIIGIIYLIYLRIQKKVLIERKNIIAGILIGIPNYFSIYYLIHSYETTNWSDSTVLAILNVSTVISSIIAGYIIFKEQLDKVKWIGLICSLLAIYLFYISA